MLAFLTNYTFIVGEIIIIIINKNGSKKKKIKLQNNESQTKINNRYFRFKLRKMKNIHLLESKDWINFSFI